MGQKLYYFKIITADSQMNFFEEAVHIQAHRKQRAFSRLAERLNRKEVI